MKVPRRRVRSIGNLYLEWIFVSRQIIYYTNRTRTDFVCFFTLGENILVTDTGLSIHKIFVERNNLLLYQTSQLVLILNSYSVVGLFGFFFLFSNLLFSVRLGCYVFFGTHCQIMYWVFWKTYHIWILREMIL